VPQAVSLNARVSVLYSWCLQLGMAPALVGVTPQLGLIAVQTVIDADARGAPWHPSDVTAAIETLSRLDVMCPLAGLAALSLVPSLAEAWGPAEWRALACHSAFFGRGFCTLADWHVLAECLDSQALLAMAYRLSDTEMLQAQGRTLVLARQLFTDVLGRDRRALDQWLAAVTGNVSDAKRLATALRQYCLQD